MPLGPYTLCESPGRHPDLLAAKHVPSDRDVLIQILPNSRAMLPRERFAFGQAITAAARLYHPNVLRILDHSRTRLAVGDLPANTDFIVFENADVGHLRDLPGERSWTRARAVVLSVLDVLAHAHALGVVHGRLDPTKVVFQRQNEGVFTKVFGFGLNSLFVADPDFLAPERRALPQAPLTPAEDIYAVGRICEEMLRNRSSSEEESYAEHPNLSQELTHWLAQMTADAPEQRFTSVADAAIAFASLPAPKSSRTVRIHAPTLSAELPDVVSAPRSMNPALDAMRVQPLTGRTDALAEALKAFDKAKETGRPALVWIRADEGLGAPSVVDQVARKISGNFGTSVLFVRHDTSLPHTSGVVAAVNAALRVNADSKEAVLNRLEQLGIDDLHTRAALVGLGEDHTMPSVPLSFTQRAQRHAAVAGWLNAKSRDRGLVVVVHGAHRSPDTLTFLHNYCCDEAANPVTFLVSSTPSGFSDEADDLMRSVLALPNASTIEMLTLSQAESRNLLTSLGVSPAMIEPIVAVAKGEPRFLKEAAFEAACDRPLPASLDDVFAARLDALKEFAHAERALGLAAVLGFTVDQTEWEMACDLARVELDLNLVQRLIELRLASYTPSGWCFESRRLHAWLLERTKARGDWQQFHHVAERIIVMRHAPFAPCRAAWHALEAERLESAQDHTLSALPLLLDVGWLDEAIHLVTEVLQARRRTGVDDESSAQLWLFRGLATLSKDPASATWWLARAQQKARELELTGLCIQASTYLCLALKCTGKPDFIRVAQETAKGALRTMTPLIAVELTLAHILAQAGQGALATSLLDRLEQLPLCPVALAAHRTLRALVALHEHAWAESLAFSISAASIAEAAGAPEHLASALLCRARAEYRLSHEDLAYTHFQQAAELQRRLRMPPDYAEFGLGIIATGRGKLDEAQAHFQRISQQNHGQPNNNARLLGHVGGLWIASSRADFEGVAEHVKHIHALLSDVCVESRDVAMVLTFVGEDLLVSSPRLARITLELAARAWESLGDQTQAYATRSKYTSRSEF